MSKYHKFKFDLKCRILLVSQTLKVLLGGSNNLI